MFGFFFSNFVDSVFQSRCYVLRYDCLGISAYMHDTRLTLIAFQNSKIACKSSQYDMSIYIHYKHREYFEYIRTVARGISFVNSKSYTLATVTSKDLQLKSNSMVWTMTAL